MALAPGQARVLISDPSEVIRRELRDTLAGGGFAVVAELAEPDDVPAAFDEMLPDVCFLGIRPGSEGQRDTEAVGAIVRRHRDARIIAVVDDVSGPGVAELVRAGARGIILRRTLDGVPVTAARWVLAGSAVVGPRLMQRLFDHVIRDAGADDRASMPGERPLTQKEREVLARIAQGYRNREIAAEFGITEGTVKCHLHQIYRKLGVRDRTAAAVQVLRAPALGAL